MIERSEKGTAAPVTGMANGAVSLLNGESKETPVDVTARVSSRGQLTIPRAVREALAIGEGDELVFRVEGERAIVARNPDLIALAGSVSIPAPKQGTPWDDVLRETRRARAATRR